jgi:histidinol-phosphate aminotransferase
MAFSGGLVEAAFADVTYGFYKVYAEAQGVKYTQVPLKADFTLAADDYCGIGKFIAIANPNAPTGIALGVNEIERIVASNPNNVVLIDEAYVDFGAQSCCKLIDKYKNLLVVMTYSKSRSLAGARLGFALADAALIADLNKLKYVTNPYSVNRLTQKCAEAALNSADYYKNCCAEIAQTREYTADALKKLGFDVLPSKANFLFAKRDGMDGEQLYLALKKRGVLVRHFTQSRIAQFNRITMGTKEQMDILLEKIKEILGEG